MGNISLIFGNVRSQIRIRHCCIIQTQQQQQQRKTNSLPRKYLYEKRGDSYIPCPYISCHRRRPSARRRTRAGFHFGPSVCSVVPKIVSCSAAALYVHAPCHELAARYTEVYRALRSLVVSKLRIVAFNPTVCAGESSRACRYLSNHVGPRRHHGRLAGAFGEPARSLRGAFTNLTSLRCNRSPL